MNLRRHRKPLGSLFLGMWLFALFVGIANACLAHAAPSHASAAGMAAMGTGSGDDCDRPVGCRQFCDNDTPLLTKLQLVQDQPAGQPLLLAAPDVPVAPVAGAAVVAIHRAHPPPVVPVILRTLRLAL